MLVLASWIMLTFSSYKIHVLGSYYSCVTGHDAPYFVMLHSLVFILFLWIMQLLNTNSPWTYYYCVSSSEWGNESWGPAPETCYWWGHWSSCTERCTPAYGLPNGSIRGPASSAAAATRREQLKAQQKQWKLEPLKWLLQRTFWREHDFKKYYRFKQGEAKCPWYFFPRRF
jgi:hypothetical protein